MTLIILISIFMLLLIISILFISQVKVFSKRKNERSCVKISVIVTARNEEQNIRNLILSLKELDYTKDCYEVILVNDHSQDQTFRILEKEIISLENFSIYDFKDPGKIGKRNALELGISKSIHPYILITDADCVLQKDWLKAYSSRFTDGFDFLFGIAPFFREKSLVNRISCFENLRNSMLTFFAANIGLSYSAAARNFGFKKTSFEKVGGYSKTTDTLSGDDDLLLREAVKNNFKIGTVTGKGSFVFSKTKVTFKDYLKQRARHTQTSFHYLFRHQFMLGLWHLFNLLILFSPVLFFLDIYFLFLFPIKLLIDLIIVLSNQQKFGYNFSFTEVLYLQIFYELFLIIHFFNAKFGRIEWK